MMDHTHTGCGACAHCGTYGWHVCQKVAPVEHFTSSPKIQDDDFNIQIDVTLEEAKENKESFFQRLEPFFAPSVILNIKLAYILAKHGHRDQFRKELDPQGAKVRYFEHVRRVALVLFDEAKCSRPEMIISALLHDGIEDTRDLTAEQIENCFGSDVCTIVKTLSKTPKEGYLDRFRICKDWRPYVIKACDRLDNLRSLDRPEIDAEFRERQIRETEEDYIPLFLQMIELTPAKCKRDAENLLWRITDQLKSLKETNE
jgi:(p)ppGpp synthase/HD superfamily hydrolase